MVRWLYSIGQNVVNVGNGALGCPMQWHAGSTCKGKGLQYARHPPITPAVVLDPSSAPTSEPSKIKQSQPQSAHLTSPFPVSFIILSLGLVAQSVEQRIEKHPVRRQSHIE